MFIEWWLPALFQRTSALIFIMLCYNWTQINTSSNLCRLYKIIIKTCLKSTPEFRMIFKMFSFSVSPFYLTPHPFRSPPPPPKSWNLCAEKPLIRCVVRRSTLGQRAAAAFWESWWAGKSLNPEVSLSPACVLSVELPTKELLWRWLLGVGIHSNYMWALEGLPGCRDVKTLLE